MKENGVAINAAGELYDGTKMDGPAGLRAALLQHADLFVLSFTESLMTYALGRRIEHQDMPAVRAVARAAAADRTIDFLRSSSTSSRARRFR